MLYGLGGGGVDSARVIIINSRLEGRYCHSQERTLTPFLRVVDDMELKTKMMRVPEARE